MLENSFLSARASEHGKLLQILCVEKIFLEHVIYVFLIDNYSHCKMEVYLTTLPEVFVRKAELL